MSEDWHISEKDEYQIPRFMVWCFVGMYKEVNPEATGLK